MVKDKKVKVFHQVVFINIKVKKLKNFQNFENKQRCDNKLMRKKYLKVNIAKEIEIMTKYSLLKRKFFVP